MWVYQFMSSNILSQPMPLNLIQGLVSMSQFNITQIFGDISIYFISNRYWKVMWNKSPIVGTSIPSPVINPWRNPLIFCRSQAQPSLAPTGPWCRRGSTCRSSGLYLGCGTSFHGGFHGHGSSPIAGLFMENPWMIFLGALVLGNLQTLLRLLYFETTGFGLFMSVHVDTSVGYFMSTMHDIRLGLCECCIKQTCGLTALLSRSWTFRDRPWPNKIKVVSKI